MFANIQYILKQDKIETEINDAKTAPSSWDAFQIRYEAFTDSLENMYTTSLGDFEIDDYRGYFIWALFFVCTILTNVIIANLMISVAADTYDRISSQNKEIHALRKKVMFLADYVFDTGLPSFGYKKRFIYTISKPKADERVHDKWEGKVTSFKESISRAAKETQEHVDKSIVSVHEEIKTSNQ